MSHDPPLSPEDLDRLEDALFDPALREALPPPLAARAKRYAEVEAMARQALSATPAPDGLEARILDRVRAELAAGDVPAKEAPTTPAPAGKARPRRRWAWIPLAGVLGAAAVVAWWVRTAPEADPVAALTPRTVSERALVEEATPAPPLVPAPEAETPARPAPPPSPAADAVGGLTGPGAAGAGGPLPGSGERGRAAEAVGRAAAGPAPATDAAPERRRKRHRRARSPAAAKKRATATPADNGRPVPLEADRADGAIGGAPAAPAAKPGPTATGGARPAPGEAAPVSWSTLARADRARRRGRCDEASALYHRLVRAPDRRLAARAHAGLGLCARRAGADPSAHFARARALDPTIDDFLRQE